MTLAGLFAALPESDIVAAIQDPSNLGKEAQVAEDLIVAAMPGLTGTLLALLVQIFVAWVYASGGGKIGPGTYKDAQTTQSRGGRNP